MNKTFADIENSVRDFEMYFIDQLLTSIKANHRPHRSGHNGKPVVMAWKYIQTSYIQGHLSLKILGLEYKSDLIFYP